MEDDASKTSGGIASYMADPPSWGLVGPSVEDDVRRIVARYGPVAVRRAVAELAKLKRGRKSIEDWVELESTVEADAREWLNGEDPFSRRSNYAVAKQFAKNNPGQSEISTHERIEKKLRKKPFDRRWHMLDTAVELSRDDYPHRVHLKAIEELEAIDTGSNGAFNLRNALAEINDYQVMIGSDPSPEMSMKDIQDARLNAVMAQVKKDRHEIRLNFTPTKFT